MYYDFAPLGWAKTNSGKISLCIT